MKWFVLGAVAAAVLAGPAHAELRTPAKVRYEREIGRSPWHEMDVTFMLGSELNSATRSFNYTSYAGYAVIFFGPGQAAVIKLKGSVIGCFGEYSASCLPSFGNAKGADQDGREWEICTSSFC